MAALIVGGVVYWLAVFSAARSISNAATAASGVAQSIVAPVDVSTIPRQGATFKRSPLEDQPPTPLPTVLGPGMAPPMDTPTPSEVVAGGPIQEQAATATASATPPETPTSTATPAPTETAQPAATAFPTESPPPSATPQSALPTATAAADLPPTVPASESTVEPTATAIPTEAPLAPTADAPTAVETTTSAEPSVTPDLGSPPIAAEGRAPRLVMPHPEPGAVVVAGVVQVNVRVRADSDVALVRAAVDDVRQDVTLEQLDEGVWLARFSATVGPGQHRVWVRAQDANDLEASFAWEFEAR